VVVVGFDTLQLPAPVGRTCGRRHQSKGCAADVGLEAGEYAAERPARRAVDVLGRRREPFEERDGAFGSERGLALRDRTDLGDGLAESA